MKPLTKQGSLALWLTGGTLLLIVALAVGGVAVWRMSTVSHSAEGTSQRQFIVDVDYDKFRKLMVRKDATSAILKHSGMQLIEQQLQGVNIELPQGERPLLNALRGSPQSELAATKQIVVQLQDPELGAERLSLTQNADIQPDHLSVDTTANQPAGKLEAYQTKLLAERVDRSTQVTVSVEMRVRVEVPKMFISRADERVQQAAEKATDEQAAAIEQFISDHQSELIVLPELK